MTWHSLCVSLKVKQSLCQFPYLWMRQKTLFSLFEAKQPTANLQATILDSCYKPIHSTQNQFQESYSSYCHKDANWQTWYLAIQSSLTLQHWITTSSAFPSSIPSKRSVEITPLQYDLTDWLSFQGRGSKWWNHWFIGFDC